MRKSEMRLSFCRADLLAICLVAAVAILVGLFFLVKTGEQTGSMVAVYQDGRLLTRMPLSHETDYVVEGTYTNHIVIRDGKVSIAESDCPGTDCVHSGWIYKAGRSIVCLPNRVELRIEGASEVDFVVR